MSKSSGSRRGFPGLLVAGAVALACVGPLAMVDAHAGEGTVAPVKPMVWPAGDLKWAAIPGIKGASIAVLWGDPKSGAYGALRKMPGGTDLGWHKHTADQRVVVVSGQVRFEVEGEPARVLEAGSFVSMPGDVPHAVACKAGADCVLFEEQAAASDFKPVEKK